MALNDVSLSAGDRGNTVAQRAPRGGLSPPASALATVSGDSALVARPEATHPGPPLRQATQPGARPERRRATGSGWGSPRSVKGRDPDGRRRCHAARFSPYPAPGAELDLLR
uniref:Chromosome 11 open reading frame 71 n=2 Tax=Myotis lucifugus TaxID=59463 RepID=G1PYG3_MYOLU